MRLFDNMFSTPFYETVVKTVTKRSAQFIKEFKPGYEKLANKLAAMSDKMFLIIQQAANERDEFNCLCHCDLWTNNIMFNDSLPPESNALLIDFQMVHAGSPVLDTCYALFSSSEVSAREKEFEFLLAYYHDHLASTLKQLGYKNEIPTLDVLQNQTLRLGVYGVPLGIWGTIQRYVEDNKENGQDEWDLLTSDSERITLSWYSLFNNPKCHDKVMFLLNYFDSNGYFDVRG